MALTYEPIASTTLSTSGTAVTFDNIPQTFTDLVLISQALTIGNTFASDIYFNNDTATNYSYQRIYGSGSGLYADNGKTTSQSLGGWGTGTNTGVPITFETHIFSYRNTNIFKTFITNPTEPPNASGSNYVGFICSMWRSTSAITSVTFKASNTFGSGSKFTLYGIKGA